MVRGKLIFISGGVRSGKSAHAEKMLINHSKENQRLVYIASGRTTDEEMTTRIAKHRKDRAPFNWHTIEQPIDLEGVLPRIQEGDCVLWDCMTTWLANELYEGWERGTPCIEEPTCMVEKEVKVFQTLEKLRERVAVLAIVSNEVFHDLPSTCADTEIYRKWLGHLHQKVVKKADVAIEMEGGIPIYWKGARQ